MKAAIKRTIVILLLLVFVQAFGKPPQNRDDELSDARNNVAAAVAHALSEPRSDKVLLQALPARDWREATPLGNGRLGALVHGRASDERVTFNHEALYNWASRGEMPDLSGLLPKVRALLAE
jgi:alpha-L-fucosidase 2